MISSVINLVTWPGHRFAVGQTFHLITRLHGHHVDDEDKDELSDLVYGQQGGSEQQTQRAADVAQQRHEGVAGHHRRRAVHEVLIVDRQVSGFLREIIIPGTVLRDGVERVLAVRRTIAGVRNAVVLVERQLRVVDARALAVAQRDVSWWQCSKTLF